jgi:hypothetical protein
MRYSSAGAFRQALEGRLLEHAQRTRLPLVRLRRTVVFDRFLARLLAAAPGRWVLKGGLALDLRLGTRARTTRDMDLGRHDDEAGATSDLLQAAAAPLDDYFTLVIERTDRLDVVLEGAAVRYRLRAELAGRTFDTVVVDVGFGPPSGSGPDMVPGPDLLRFAGIEPVTVPIQPLEQHVAEKVHAYTRRYGTSARPSTRVKDLVDLALIASSTALFASQLKQALEETFATRGTHNLPTTFPAPPPDWVTPYRRLAQELDLDPDVIAGHALVERFLDPVLAGTLTGQANWNPQAVRWGTDQTGKV